MKRGVFGGEFLGCTEDSISGVETFLGPFRASGKFFLQKQNKNISGHRHSCCNGNIDEYGGVIVRSRSSIASLY